MRFYFRCPKCGSDEEFAKLDEESLSIGWPFVSVYSTLLFHEEQRRRVQCMKCSYIFAQPSLPSSPAAKLAGVVFVLTVIMVVVAVVLCVDPEIAGALPSIPPIAAIEEAIAAWPRIAAWLIVALLLLIAIPCWIATAMGNAKLRKQLAAQYRLQPLSSRERNEQSSRPRRAPAESPTTAETGRMP